MNHQLIKMKLFQTCINFVDQRLLTTTNAMKSLQKALLSETKSSAGDKHETGRAMIQMEMEKASQQFESIHQMKKLLSKIELRTTGHIISLGSLIETDKGRYYLSISMGEVEVEGIQYYCISTSSPIGQQLLGKTVRDSIPFNKSKITAIF